MPKVKRKEVRKSIENALHKTLTQFELSPTSKKLKKAIAEVSKEIGDQVAEELKKKPKKKDDQSLLINKRKKKMNFVAQPG